MGVFGGPSLDIYARVFGAGTATNAMTAALPQYLNATPELDELAAKVMRDVEGSEGNFRAQEGPAKEDFRFYIGSQWDDVDRMRMEQLKRPALTFNEIKPVINAVSGLERLNRVDIRFQSRAFDSPLQQDVAGDLATEAVVAADDLTNASEKDSDFAKLVAIQGMAWAEVHMSYDYDINGRVEYDQFDLSEARWDPNCHNVNLEGSEWRARKRPVSRKKFEELYPGQLDKIDMSVPDLPYGQVEKYELVTPYYSRANEEANPQVGGQTQLKKNIDVIEYQWKDMQPIYRFQDPDSGEITAINEDKWDRLTKRMEMAGGSAPPAVKQKQPVYRQVIIARGVVLEDPVDLPGGFSLLCMTGEWDPEKKRYVGLVRDMIDPQKTKNKAISSALGFHITNAKGGVLYKTSAFADPDHAIEQWARFDAKIEVNDETDIAKDIVQREPAKVSPDLGMFYQEGTRAITRVSGINEETVGLAAGQTPSQTARGRQQAGLVVLGWYWDNLNRHRRERARIMLEFIREYWTQGQLMDVGGTFNSQAVPLLKDSLLGTNEYKMVLDDSIRHNPDLRMQLWHDMLESGAMQWFLKAGMGNVLMVLMKILAPWPSYVSQEIQKVVMQNPPQQQQKGRQGAQPKQPENPQLTQAKIQHTSAQAQKVLAQARQIDQQTKQDPMQKAQEAKMKVAEMAAEAALRAHELRIRREESQSKMAQLARKTAFGMPGQGMGAGAGQ